MNLSDFIKNNDGKGLDFDGAFGFQCMDLMHFYCKDVLGIADGKVLAAPTAAQVFSNFANIKGNELFDKIDNTPDGVPQAGDIMFWNTSVGSAGHVAVFISGNANSFKSFDQNWPVGSKCHVQDHTYKGVAGWLRKKEGNMADTVTISSKQFTELVQKATQWDTTADALNIDRLDQGGGQKVVKTINDLKSSYQSLEENLNSTGKRLDALDAELQEANTEIERLKNLPPVEVVKEVPVIKEVYIANPKTAGDLWKAIRYYFDNVFGGGEKNE